MKKIIILVLLISGFALISYGMQEKKQPSFCDTVYDVCWEEADNAANLGGYDFDEMLAWHDHCVSINGC